MVCRSVLYQCLFFLAWGMVCQQKNLVTLSLMGDHPATTFLVASVPDPDESLLFFSAVFGRSPVPAGTQKTVLRTYTHHLWRCVPFVVTQCPKVKKAQDKIRLAKNFFRSTKSKKIGMLTYTFHRVKCSVRKK